MPIGNIMKIKETNYFFNYLKKLYKQVCRFYHIALSLREKQRHPLNIGVSASLKWTEKHLTC